MGLEQRFRGSVEHLRIARDVRLAQGEESPRQYLVIYDSVPGGTGYLKELMRDPAPLFEVLHLSLAGLQGCRCAADESLDGCYRCLYGYHNSSDRKHVSRRAAVHLLQEILGHQTELKQVANISDVVANNSLFDSELERRFIEALRRRPADGAPRFEVRDEVVRGKPAYSLQVGNRLWTVEPQVDLGAGRASLFPASRTSCCGRRTSTAFFQLQCSWMAGDSTRSALAMILPNAWRWPAVAGSACGR